MRGRTAIRCGVTLFLLVVLGALSAPGAFAADPAASAAYSAAGVDADKTLSLESVGVFPRHNVWWPYRTGPVYGEPASAVGAPADSVVLPVGSFRAGESLNIPPELMNGLQTLENGGYQYFLVKLRAEGPDRQALASIAPVVAEVPVNALVMRLDRAAYDRVSASPAVVFVQPYHAAYKINPEVGAAPQASAELAASPLFNLAVLLFKGESAAPVLAALAASGVTPSYSVAEAGDDQLQIELRGVPASVIPQLARMEAVWRIGERGVYALAGTRGALYLQTPPGAGAPGDFPYWKVGLQGDQQLIQITDTGLSVDAADLADTRADSGWTGVAPTNVIANHRKVAAYLTAATYSGTGDYEIGAGDLLGCDAPARGAFTHGHLVTATALGAGTRGLVPAGTAPSPTDGSSSWNPNQTWTTAYGLGFYQDASPQDGLFKEADPAASAVDIAYDGIAKGARVVFVDASTTCPEPSEPTWTNLHASGDTLYPGSIYRTIAQTWLTYGAAIHNFSFGTYHTSAVGATYSPGGAYDTDAAVSQYPANVVIWAVGNAGSLDAYYDGSNTTNGTTFNEASCKNCLAVGASEGVGGSVVDLTSEGPNSAAGKRHVVTVLAQGRENACRSDEAVEEQTGFAGCADTGVRVGTSLAAANMAGAAAIMREYFAQGFYPDGTDQNSTNAADKLPSVSSRLFRAMAIAGGVPVGGSYSAAGLAKYRPRYRFNYVTGWGQFYLSRVLPLAAYSSRTVNGLVVSDYFGSAGNGTSGSNVSRSDLVWDGTVGKSPVAPNAINGVTMAEFQVLNTDQDLAVGLVWDDPETSDALVNDLDLKVRYCGPDHICGNSDDTYWNGDAFDTDINEDGTLDPTPIATGGCEDIQGDGIAHQWWYSISNRDVESWTGSPRYDRETSPAGCGFYGRWDNQEGVVIPSAVNAQAKGAYGGDVDGDGTPDLRYLEDINGDDGYCWRTTPCKRIGKWRVEVYRRTGTTTSLPFALVIAGPVSGASSARFDVTPATCSSAETVVIEETNDPTDTLCNLSSGCPASVIKSRTTVQVLKPDGTVRDRENYLDFANSPAGTLRFQAVRPLSVAALTPNYDDGVLEAQDGDTLKVIYTDSSRQAVATTSVKCAQGIDVAVIRQVGPDTPFILAGGCDDDRYLDQGESFALTAQYYNPGPYTLVNATAALTCQSATGNYLRVTDANKSIGDLGPLTSQRSAWGLQVVGAPPGRTRATCHLCLASAAAGLSTPSCVDFQFLMQADDEKHYYITDCPTGCGSAADPVLFDRNNDEKIEDLVKPNLYDTNDVLHRNRPEKVVYEDLTDTTKCYDASGAPISGCGNPGLAAVSPNGWNFDTGRQGFTTGRDGRSTKSAGTASIVNWGEDSNWDDTLERDLGEDVSNNGKLDQSWSTLGGCGWMSKANNTTTPGGIWHTGAIGTWTSSYITRMCGVSVRANDALCKQYDREVGTTGEAYWWEALRTPTIHPVHFGTDPDGFAWKTQILDWSWNLQLDTDAYAGATSEFDLDLQSASPTQLGDATVQQTFGSGVGLVYGGQISVYGGAPAFAATCFKGGGCVGTNPVTGASFISQFGDEVRGIIPAGTPTPAAGNRRGARGCYFNDLNVAGTENPYYAVRQPQDSDDDCDNDYSLGSDGCPGKCGVDDDGNGLIDDIGEICPCLTCNGGPHSGLSCLGSQAYCNPGGGHAYLCLLTVDAAGKPLHKYGDDICGDGTTDEYVNASFSTGTATKIRQVRNFDVAAAGGVNDEASPSGDLWYNRLEDFYGPAGKDWAAELGFVVSESSGRAESARSYGMGVDDMVVEWMETHPVAQSGTRCTTTNNTYFQNNGECASLALGVLEITGEGDVQIPVSVIDPYPGAQLGECTLDGTAGVYVKAYSGADLTGERYCLKPTTPGGMEFKGVIKATTRINVSGDGYVYTAYDGIRTPAVTIRFFDKYDGNTAHNNGPGPDGKPGVANFDDDGNATGPACGAIVDCGSAPSGGCANTGGLCCPGSNVTGCDNIEEQCGEGVSSGAGRGPHMACTPYRWSDDTCGCPGGCVQENVPLSYNAMDLVVSDVRVRDGWGGAGHGDGDGYPDPKEDVVVDIKVRNLSNFPVENLELTLSPTSGPVACMLNDKVVIPRLEKNKTFGYEWDTYDHSGHFEFIAGGANGRVNPTDDYGSEWTVTVRGTGKADGWWSSLTADTPISGTAVVQHFKLQHNLNASGGGRAADWVEDFESYNNDNSVFCKPAAGTSRCTTAPYIKRNTGDDAAELIGTHCQVNNPDNPYGLDTQPENFCQLGEGYDNTANHWHLDAPDDPLGGPTCERTGAGACVDGGRSHKQGSKCVNSGMYKSIDTTGGDNNVGSIWNRMYWFKTRDSKQLGVGGVLSADATNGVPQACTPSSCPAAAANQAPVLEQWVQISTLDWRVFSNVPQPVVMDAAATYICVDKNNNGDCDTKEDGLPPSDPAYNSEHWEVLKAYFSPEQGYRLNNWINCMYDPSDDGNTENDFYDGSVVIGPSSTCYPQMVDSCVGATDTSRAGLTLRLAASCWPETGTSDEGENGYLGFGRWIKRLYNLKPYRGQNVLFRWHVSPGALSGLPDSTAYSLFNRDDGWYIDDIHLYGRATGMTLASDNTNHNTSVSCPSVKVHGLVSRVAAIEYPRSNADGSLKRASGCSEAWLPYCDFNGDGTIDAYAESVASAGPGRAYILDGSWTSADACLGGTIEYRFEDSNGAVVRDWLTDPVTTVAPVQTTGYYLLARCSAQPATVSASHVLIETCTNRLELTVTAPSGPNNLTWTGPGVAWDVVKGVITEYGGFNPSATPACLKNSSTTQYWTDSSAPPLEGVLYYIVKEHGTDYTYSESATCGASDRDSWAPRNICP